MTDVRAGLPSKLRREGNVAVADVDIDGLPSQISGHSRIGNDNITHAMRDRGIVGNGSGNFKAQTIPNSQGHPINRATDSEYKILDNIADRLGNNTFTRGSVNIFTERPACGSCQNVADQFRQKYPNISVTIRDNNGVVLRSPRTGQ